MFRCGIPAKSGAGCTPRASSRRRFRFQYCAAWQLSNFPAGTFVSAMLFISEPHWQVWRTMRQAAKQSREQKHRSGLRLGRKADPVIGALLCGAGAGAATLIAANYTWRVFVPLAFTLVLLLISLVFGARAGMIGTLLAATVFAAFLFPPLGNISVMDSGARTNIAWMLLIGFAFSFLFAPPTSGLHRQ
jgi:K+-sensing histidine kinase KdpD